MTKDFYLRVRLSSEQISKLNAYVSSRNSTVSQVISQIIDSFPLNPDMCLRVYLPGNESDYFEFHFLSFLPQIGDLITLPVSSEGDVFLVTRRIFNYEDGHCSIDVESISDF